MKENNVFVVMGLMRGERDWMEKMRKLVSMMEVSDHVTLSASVENSDLLDRIREICVNVYNCKVAGITHGKMGGRSHVVRCRLDCSGLVFDGKFDRKVFK